MILTVAFLDVFHGDCAVITFKEGGRNACIVIDGGEKKDAAKRLAAYLKYEQVEIIDLLVGTHIDQDHIYGLVQFLEKFSDKASSWNRGRKKCIHHYWGTKADPDWTPSPKKRHRRAPAVSFSESEMANYVTQSVKQNQNLDKLVREHIFNLNNMRYPSLSDMPPSDILPNVELRLLAPDIQIPDSAIHAKAMRISDAPYRKLLSTGNAQPGKGLTLSDLEGIVAYNAEEMAKIANRHANNQSIVFKLTPKEANAAVPNGWSFLFSGDAEHESWEMMRQSTAVKRNLRSKVLKVPHHGSTNGIDEASLKAVNPEYSIVSVGQKHGLPDAQTLNSIRVDKKRKLFCTERNNSRSKPGPCGEKECIRSKNSDFRSIRFTIDTDTGEEKIDTFTVNSKLGEIEPKTGEIWCPENKWPTD